MKREWACLESKMLWIFFSSCLQEQWDLNFWFFILFFLQVWACNFKSKMQFHFWYIHFDIYILRAFQWYNFWFEHSLCLFLFFKHSESYSGRKLFPFSLGSSSLGEHGYDLFPSRHGKSLSLPVFSLKNLSKDFFYKFISSIKRINF